MKYLVIAALFALLIVLVYSRLYPYLKMLKKILGVAKTIGSPPDRSEASINAKTRPDRQLVRCVGCGTWIPSKRAIGVGGGLSAYCSRECIEKSSNGNERKIAG